MHGTFEAKKRCGGLGLSLGTSFVTSLRLSQFLHRVGVQLLQLGNA
jgi:hypothetical protein